MNESLTFQGCEKVNTVARGKSKNISLHLLPTVFSTVCENMRCKHMRKKNPICIVCHRVVKLVSAADAWINRIKCMQGADVIISAD